MTAAGLKKDSTLIDELTTFGEVAERIRKTGAKFYSLTKFQGEYRLRLIGPKGLVFGCGMNMVKAFSDAIDQLEHQR